MSPVVCACSRAGAVRRVAARRVLASVMTVEIRFNGAPRVVVMGGLMRPNARDYGEDAGLFWVGLVASLAAFAASAAAFFACSFAA